MKCSFICGIDSFAVFDISIIDLFDSIITFWVLFISLSTSLKFSLFSFISDEFLEIFSIDSSALCIVCITVSNSLVVFSIVSL